MKITRRSITRQIQTVIFRYVHIVEQLFQLRTVTINNNNKTNIIQIHIQIIRMGFFSGQDFNINFNPAAAAAAGE